MSCWGYRNAVGGRITDGEGIVEIRSDSGEYHLKREGE